MKRTGEVTLTTIGLIFSFFSAMGVIIGIFFFNTDAFREGFEEGFNEGNMEDGLSTSPGEADVFLNFLLGFGWLFFVVLLIGTILGAIAVYFFVGDKKPKAASIISIVAAVLVTIGTGLTGIILGILYLIAGIMGLVRKPPTTYDPHVVDNNLHSKQNKPDEFN